MNIFLRVMGWTAAIFALVVGSFIIFLPTMLSTEWGLRQALAEVNARTSVIVSVRKAQFSWFDQQRVSGLIVSDVNGKRIASVDDAAVSQGLFSLLVHGYDFSEVVVKELNLDLTIDNTIKPLFIHHANASVIHTNNGIVQISASGKTKADDIEGQFSLTSEMMKEKKEGVDDLILQVMVHNFPVRFLDQVATLKNSEFRGVLLAALGDTISISIDENQNNQLSASSWQVTSPNLKGSFQASIDTERFTLLKPAHAEMQFTPELFSKLTGELPFSLKSPVQLNIDVQELDLPIAKGEYKKTFGLKGEVTSHSPFVFKNPFDSDDISLDAFTVLVEGTSLSDLNSSITVKLGVQQNQEGVLAHVLGNDTLVNISTLAMIDDKGKIRLDDIHAKVNGERINAELRGEVNKNTISLLSPASINIALSEQVMQYLISAEQYETITTFPSTLAMTIAPGSLSLSAEGFKQLIASGHLQVNTFSIALNGDTLVVKELVMPWEIEGGEHRIKIGFSGKSQLTSSDKTQEGTFRGKAVVKNFYGDEKALQAKLEATLVDFPSEFVALIVGKAEISKLLGPMISADFELATPIHDGMGQLQMSIHGDGLYVEAAVDIKDRIVLADRNKPARVEINLTPQRFDSVLTLFGSRKQQLRLALEGTTNALFVLDNINIPLKTRPSPQMEYWNCALSGKLKVDNFRLLNKKNGDAIAVEQFETTFNSDNIGEELHLDLHASVNNGSAAGGKLSAQGLFQELFDADGNINRETPSLIFGLKAENLHVTLLSNLIPYPTMPEKLEAILGDPVNGQIDIRLIKMNGPVKANFSGTNGRFVIDGNLSDGVFTLLQPFAVEVTATPMLGKYVLSDVAPFLGGLKSAENKIKIFVNNKGFQFPVRKFDLTKIVIQQGTIDAGKMYLSSKSNMQTVMALLGKEKHDEFSIWLTPIYFHLGNGTLKLERVDMLLDKSFPLAAWGTMDFVKDKVNMVIGIRGTALANAFSLIGLSPDYMLQLPLKGPTNNPSIDKRKAAARISALVAQTQGPQGMLVGTVLEMASGSLIEDPVPPPTTSPLPWHGTESAPAEKAPKKESSIQKEIKKGASSLLQNLIK